MDCIKHINLRQGMRRAALSLPWKCAAIAAITIFALLVSGCSENFVQCKAGNGVLVFGPFGSDCPNNPTDSVSNVLIMPYDSADLLADEVSFDLVWTNPTASDLSYIVIRWIDVQAQQEVGRVTIGDPTPGVEASYSISGLVPERVYEVFIGAIDDDQNKSTIVSIIRSTIPLVSDFTAIQAFEENGTVVDLAWENDHNEENALVISWDNGSDGDSGLHTIHGTMPGETGRAEQYRVTDLTPQTTYTFSIITLDGIYESGEQQQLVTLDSEPPQAVYDIISDSFGLDGVISFTWVNPDDIDLDEVQISWAVVGDDITSLTEWFPARHSETGNVTIGNLIIGERYRFVFTTVDQSGNKTAVTRVLFIPASQTIT